LVFSIATLEADGLLDFFFFFFFEKEYLLGGKRKRLKQVAK